MSPRAGIDKQKVVQAAVRMVNKKGPEALTINRLAAELGIKPPSLYNHIGGLSDLLVELSIVNARQMGACMADSVIGKSGPDAIRTLARAYRSYIRENAGLYMATLMSSNNRQTDRAELKKAEDRVVSIVQAVLSVYNMSEEDTLHTIRALRSMVHGFTTIEIAGGFGLSLDRDESFDRLIEMLIHGIA